MKVVKDIREEDFSTLIPLDACRFDTYSKFRRQAECRLSPGRTTSESLPIMFPFNEYP